MSKQHELTNENSTLHYCDSCRKEVFRGTARNQASALCRYQECGFCGKVAVCNVLAPDHSKTNWIPLNEDGTAKEIYVEREGV